MIGEHSKGRLSIDINILREASLNLGGEHRVFLRKIENSEPAGYLVKVRDRCPVAFRSESHKESITQEIA
jgi:hypothetical protein